MKKEIWKDIPSYPGYQASNYGRIRSINRTKVDSLGRTVTRRGKVLKGYHQPGGYCRTELIGKCVLVHRLVAEAFLGIPKPGIQVNHKDYNKHNNKISNLEYCTRSQNVSHGYDSGLRRAAGGMPVLGKKEIEVIRYLHAKIKVPCAQISKLFGRHESTITAIIRGKTWTRR